MSRSVGRRQFLASAALVAGTDAAPARATAAPSRSWGPPAQVRDGFDIHDLELAGELTRRAWVLVPSELGPNERPRLLLLWHGLGETSSPSAGVAAWVDRYGLLTSYARLSSPPVRPTSRRGDLPAEHAQEINQMLEQRPFRRAIVFVCPYTPNVWKLASPPRALDLLADWVADGLLPEVRARTPGAIDATRTSIDGCSLGGFVGLQIFLRRPQLFAACGSVQAALSEAGARALADRLAAAIAIAGPRPIHLQTSRDDPFRAAHLALSRELRRAGVPHDLVILPGPHDQPWLREAGTPEMLLWHDRALPER